MTKYVTTALLLLGTAVTSVLGQTPISSIDPAEPNAEPTPAAPSIRVDPQQIRMLMDKARTATLEGNKAQADGYHLRVERMISN